MDSKDTTKEEIMSKRSDMLLELKRRLEEATIQLNTQGSTLDLPYLQNLYNQAQKLVQASAKAKDPSKMEWIHDELDKVFVVENVGHPCDLCQGDLASDPERPGASLRSLQEACVLACGHVYHSKCLKGTTLDLDNHSADPSCVFCVSSAN